MKLPFRDSTGLSNLTQKLRFSTTNGGKCCVELGECDSAIEGFDEVEKLAPGSRLVAWGRGNASGWASNDAQSGCRLEEESWNAGCAQCLYPKAAIY